MIYGQYGVGLMRLEMLKKEKRFFVKNKEDKDIEVVVLVLSWWFEEGYGFI